MTASYLYYPDKGNEICVFCSGNCSNNYKALDYIKKTFTNYNLLKNPDGVYICNGCIESISSKNIKELIMPDGEIKKDQSARTYSWVLTKKEKWAYSKRHIMELRKRVLNPPNPPFAIIISDSGKKHIIFRSPIAFDKINYSLQFEEEIIQINTEQLKERIILCEKIIAFCGKKGVLVYDNFRVSKYCLSSGMVEEKLLINFLNVKEEQLTQLAVFLSQNKEACFNEYYFNKEPRRISEKTCMLF